MDLFWSVLNVTPMRWHARHVEKLERIVSTVNRAEACAPATSTMESTRSRSSTELPLAESAHQPIAFGTDFSG